MVTTSPPLSEDPEDVLVSLEDLDAVRAALNSAYWHQWTYDTMESYRKLASNVQPSAMTGAIGRALGLVESYLNPPEVEAEVEEDEVETQ